MGSDYFTHETIGHKSLAMFQKLKQYREFHKMNFMPKRSALLIIDMQKYFLEEDSHAFAPSALPIVPKIKKLANKYLEMNLPVILTRHLNTEEDARIMAQWWADIITESDELSEIFPEFNLPNTTLVRKTQYDAFYQTPLGDILKEKRIHQVVITGVLTHLCCETTARSAFVRGFTVFLPIDGTATYNEEFHWATVLNLSHGFAIPVLIGELQDFLEVSQSGH